LDHHRLTPFWGYCGRHTAGDHNPTISDIEAFRPSARPDAWPTLIGLLAFCLTVNVASAEAPQTMLSEHNSQRSKHCVPALTWSADLAAAAQAYADGCEFEHSKVPGENLAWGTGLSGRGATDMWYSEITKYNFAAPVWSTEVGHFTQVVWRNSAQIGCAMASCSGLNYWVCRYSPPGNWNVDTPGELAQNVPPPCIERVPKPPSGADIFKKMRP
jgi:pathogenesis-related protein 1